MNGQLDLFATDTARKPSSRRSAERLEEERARATEIAACLPEALRFGTSSWSFPDWEGLVYPARWTAAELARNGLREYVLHPLLRTVGIDRSYYAPIPAEDLERYAAQLPPGFPCCAKAPEAVTSPVLGDRTRGPLAENPDFLRPRRFVEEMIEPFRAHFAEHTGPFVIQLPPAPPAFRLPPDRFARALEEFLSALPRGFRYAVELRDASLLTDEYAAVLRRHGAGHVYNYAAAMPLPAEQAFIARPEAAHFMLIRLLLPPGTRYMERRDALWPFVKAGEPDPVMREQVVDLVRRGLSTGNPVYVLVNNKAEGCAPLTVRALAELLAEDPGA
ncbi:MAG: DUF72 domain-containing protein [Thermoanaerobaculia bacterium]